MSIREMELTMKNQTPSIRRLSFALLTLALGGLSACGVDEADATEAEEGALVIPPGPTGPLIPISQTCQGQPADASMTGDMPLVYSPTKYGTAACPKAYVVDADPSIWDANDTLVVTWADPWSRNERQCTGGTLKLDLWSRGPGELWFRKDASVESPLKWFSAPGWCAYPQIFLFRGMNEAGEEDWNLHSVSKKLLRSLTGRSLRFVASALSPGGSSTQPLRVHAF